MIFKFILNFKFIFAVRTNDESGKCIYKTYSVPKSEHLVSKQNVGKFILKRLKKLQVIRIKKNNKSEKIHYVDSILRDKE